eukprot:7118246-Pyramimonas_sp.AAC.1
MDFATRASPQKPKRVDCQAECDRHSLDRGSALVNAADARAVARGACAALASAGVRGAPQRVATKK